MKRTRIAPSVERNEACGMVTFVCRARKHVANAATDDRSDDAEDDVQKIAICTCITDFAITPEISPIRIYQIKSNILFPTAFAFGTSRV
jgi:hypothetical protein